MAGHAFLRPLLRALLAALAAGGASVAHAALLSGLDPATGALNVGSDGPGSTNIKVEVAAGGRVTVIDNTGATAPRTYPGVGVINVTSGAGDDLVEFDINSSQSLALSVATGAGDATENFGCSCIDLPGHRSVRHPNDR